MIRCAFGDKTDEQERTPSIPSKHVPNEGRKGDYTKDIYAPRIKYAIREAIRPILYRARRCWTPYPYRARPQPKTLYLNHGHVSQCEIWSYQADNTALDVSPPPKISQWLELRQISCMVLLKVFGNQIW